MGKTFKDNPDYIKDMFKKSIWKSNKKKEEKKMTFKRKSK